MTSIPTLSEGGTINIQGPTGRVAFRVLITELPSTYFFGRKAKRVEKTQAYFDLAEKQAAEFPAYDENVIFRSSDGFNLLWFIKDIMRWSYGTAEQSIEETSLYAIKSLVGIYPPHLPKARGPVGMNDVLQEQKKWHDLGYQYGDYHFAYWHSKGRPYDPAKISKDSRPKQAHLKARVENYMQQTIPEHAVASEWLRVLDPDSWKKYHDCYQSLRDSGSLKHLDQGEHGCFTGQALLINIAVKPHRDTNDDRDGWVATNCWGSFQGGDAVFPELGVRLKQGAGDLLFSKSADLEHWIRAITEGERFGSARFMKNNVLNSYEPTFRCTYSCTNRKYTKKESLARHIRMVHPAEWAAEHPGWNAPLKPPRKRIARRGDSKR